MQILNAKIKEYTRTPKKNSDILNNVLIGHHKKKLFLVRTAF